MKNRYLTLRPIAFATGASLLGLMIGGCNKQSGAPAGGVPTVAPPIAALPLLVQSSPVAPAPSAAALPAAATIIPYAPPPPRQSYRYIDHAYAIGQAFADTPPDYAVDYQGTRPWVWRARNGAYRIVERLPRGERYYYYEPGANEPFLVRGPDYTYAYEGGDLAVVYGPDGSELDRAEAARRADEASRYLYRARSLYRAAQYDQRQSAYANEWANHRGDLMSEQFAWSAAQSRNQDWRRWHDQHAADEQRRWRDEEVQRAAYAAAIGAASSPGAALRDPRQLASRQAAYFSSWNGRHGAARPSEGQGTTPVPSVKPNGSGAPPAQIAQQAPGGQQKPAAKAQQQSAKAAAPQVNPAQVSQDKASQAQAIEAQNAQRAAAAAAAVRSKEAQAKAAQAAQSAAQERQRSAAAAQANAAQANRAAQASAAAKQHEAAAVQAKSAEEAHAQQIRVAAQQHEAVAAQTRAAEAAHAQQTSAEAAEANARQAQAKAHRAQQMASQAKQQAAAAEQARNEETKHAQQMAAQATQHRTAATQAKTAEPQHGPQQGQSEKPAPAADHGKAQANKPRPTAEDHHQDQQH